MLTLADESEFVTGESLTTKLVPNASVYFSAGRAHTFTWVMSIVERVGELALCRRLMGNDSDVRRLHFMPENQQTSKMKMLSYGNLQPSHPLPSSVHPH